MTIYIDTSGEGLHKRGYRKDSAPAPIKETLAAALVSLSGWRPGFGLWDPYCGSGTIAIEAAMAAKRVAPGLLRSFVCENWTYPARKIWEEEREKARSQIVVTVPSNNVLLAGSDISRHAVMTARNNAKIAGVGDVVRFFQADAEKMNADFGGKLAEVGVEFPKHRSIVSNPPYGERLDNKEAARQTIREWGSALAGFSGWAWCVISPHEDFESLIGRKASKLRKLNNGRIKCNAFIYKPIFDPAPLSQHDGSSR